MTSLGQVGRAPIARRDPARRRAWLAAAAAALLLLLWLSVENTYLHLRPPPYRYTFVAPGAWAHGENGDFRLLSWQQSPSWGTDYDGQPQSPDPGAVWVVAQLEVVPTARPEYFDCAFTLVGLAGRQWSGVSVDNGEVEGDSCVPDPKDVEIGKTYRFHQGYQVPEDQIGRLVGLSQHRFILGRNALLLPPS